MIKPDQCKATILREKLQDPGIRQIAGLPETHRHREDSLRQEIIFLEHLVLAARNDSSTTAGQKLVAYQARLLAAKNRYEAYLAETRQKHSNFFQLKYSAAPTLTQLRHQLAATGTTLVEYFATDSVFYLFRITAEDLQLRQVRRDAQLDSAIYRTAAIQHAGDIDQFATDAHRLYRSLLAPALSSLPYTAELVIIPDGPLHYLPFQILLEKAPSPETLAAENWRELPYLIKTKNIRYEYSAALLLEQSPRRRPHQHYYSGFAPAFSGQPLASRGIGSAVANRHWRGGLIPDLKQNRPEVQTVHQLLRTGQAFLAEAATERAFKQIAPQCRLLHLATHACADDEDPLYSQILFSPDSAEDGALHAYELYNMQLSADLAVLSACQTGAGRLQRGEGVMSLSRAFKYAGCPNIVMSLWNADDDASKNIILRFFEHLKAGQNKDDALSQAQRDYLRQATLAEAHPSRWATFVLIGDDKPVEFSSPVWWVALLTLGLCALIVYVFFGRAQ